MCLCELTVAVFASDIEKMGCVCVCATVQRIYLSIHLTCVCLYGHSDGTGLCLSKKEKKRRASLPNIVTSGLLLMLDCGIIH